MKWFLVFILTSSVAWAEFPFVEDDPPMQVVPVRELPQTQLPFVEDDPPKQIVPARELLQVQLPSVEDEQTTAQEFFFSGQLRTNAPSYLLSPEDFTALQNYRYSPAGIEGRYGMSKYGTDSGYIIPHVKKDDTTAIHYQAAACTFAQVNGEIFKGDSTGIKIYNYSTPAWDALGDDWSGDWLYPNGAVVDAGTGYKDYTGFIYLDNTSTYLKAGALTSSDEIYLGFVDIPSEIWLDFVPGVINTNASVMTLSRWTGAAYADATETDGTNVSGDTFGQSGQLTNITTTSAATSTKYNIPHALYWFKIVFSATISDDVNVWQVRAKPVSNPPTGYTSVAAFKERLWLYGDSDNPNIFRYSKRNAPEIWNGSDSSVLEVGAQQKISFALPFYNEMMVFKTTGEVGLIEGYSPSTFAYEIISSYSGAVAPQSIVAVETGVMAGGNKKTVAIYLSSDGVRMCDGLTTPLISQDISAYFDKNNALCIAATDMDDAVAWMDYGNNEYHLSVPNSPELVYDIDSGKWTIFVRAPATFTNAVTFFSGNQWLSLAGTASHIYELEDGTTDNGTAVTYVVESKDHWQGDFFHNYRNFLLFSSQATGAAVTLYHALDGKTAYTNDGAISVAKSSYNFCAPDEPLNIIGSSARWKLSTTNRLQLYKYAVQSKPVRTIYENPGN